MEHKKRAIFYLIDGARPDILEQLAGDGEIPNIKKYCMEQGAYITGTTCLPSTTGPAYLPFLTGKFPGDHGITGIRWFDKEEYFRGRWRRNSMRSYCGYEAKYFNDDMNPTFPSLMELYPESYNIYNMVTKGVDEEKDVTKKGKSKLYFDAHFKHFHHRVDELGHEKLISIIEKDFDFIFAVFPSIDWDSHTYHYKNEKTIEAYRIADRSLGKVISQLKSLDKYEDTLIILASDHGLSATHTHLDLGKFFRQNKYRVLEYPTIWTLFPEVAVFISGNSFATLSFLDQQEMYYKEDLFKKHGKVLDKLVSHEAIDFIVTRKSENSLAVIDSEGEAEMIIKDNRVNYRPVNANPLGLPSNDNFMDAADSFSYTFKSEYPDALEQCRQLFANKRSGDIAVMANLGYDLRDFWEIPEHKGSHGSLHREHMHVPILMNKKLLHRPVRTSELYDLINNYLSPSNG